MTAKMTAVSRDETEMREAFKVFDRNGDGKENVKVSNDPVIAQSDRKSQSKN